MKKLFLIFSTVIFLASCTKNRIEDKIRDTGAGYYRGTIGSWVIYDVDSFVYKDFNQDTQEIDAFHYELKEIIESKFLNSAGKETLRLERYKRLNDSLPWEIAQVWTANITSSGMEKVEDNNRIVKLVFPVKELTTWNGNQFNMMEELNFLSYIL